MLQLRCHLSVQERPGPAGWPIDVRRLYGTLSSHVHDGHAGSLDLSNLKVILSLRYHDAVRPSTPWEAVLYVDDRADVCAPPAARRHLPRSRGRDVRRPVRAGHREVHAVRRAQITVEHIASRKRIDVTGYITVRGDGVASDPDDVQCGIPG